MIFQNFRMIVESPTRFTRRHCVYFIKTVGCALKNLRGDYIDHECIGCRYPHVIHLIPFPGRMDDLTFS